MVFGTQDYGDSECSGPTGEYGLHPSSSSSEVRTQEMEIGRTKKDSWSKNINTLVKTHRNRFLKVALSIDLVEFGGKGCSFDLR